MDKVVIRVPATSANIGPGFDTLGCAFNLYNKFTFTLAGDRLEITGCEEKYANKDNLAICSFYAALDKIGVARPVGLRLHIEADVPVSRGLGSSSTLLIAGAMAANELYGGPLSRDDILAMCSEIEGHPDNIAPAVRGGLVASVLREGKPVVVRYDISPDVMFTALVPDFPTSTEEARAVLPKTVPRLDAVYTVGCLAVLLKGLETNDREALQAALDDKLHQPYRFHMIDQYSDVRETALSLGCDGFVISGSGSTCLCVGGGQDFPHKMESAPKNFRNNWKVYPLEVDTEGAKIIGEE